MNVRIVIPVFNEAATVREVVGAACRYAPVLVIDDGSSDASAALAITAGAEVIRHSRRLGKAQALRTGAAAARQRGATHMVTLDGDGQHAAEDLPTVLAAAGKTPNALILGSRVGAGDQASGVPTGRLNAIHVAGFFVNWVSGLQVADTQSGFRVYPLDVLASLGTRRGGFVFETEVLVAAAAGGVSVVEVPITAIPRAGRRSRFRPIADGAAIATYLAGQTVGRWAIEARAAGSEVAALLDRDRRRVRHAAVLAVAAARGDSLPGWGLALAVAGAERVTDRVVFWWRHPRRCRAAAAATACLGTPLLLGLAVVQTLTGRILPDVVTPLVRVIYAPDRLSRVDAPAPLRGSHEEPRASLVLASQRLSSAGFAGATSGVVRRGPRGPLRPGISEGAAEAPSDE